MYRGVAVAMHRQQLGAIGESWVSSRDRVGCQLQTVFIVMLGRTRMVNNNLKLEKQSERTLSTLISSALKAWWRYINSSYYRAR